MPPVFSASAYQIEQVFKQPHHFVSPSYQRRFCWGVDEAGRLLDNLLEAFAEAGADDAGGSNVGRAADYFLGTILLVQSSRSTADATRFDIVDGQQRLVTMTILLAVLRDLMMQARPAMVATLHAVIGSNELSRADTIGNRVTLPGPDGLFLSEHVQRLGSCLELPDEDLATDAQQSMFDIREHFIAELEDRESANLEAFTDYVLRHCSIVMIMTGHIDRAHRMFTVLNDAGKQLKRNDILKAELLGTVPADSASHYLAIWEDLEGRLGDSFESVFSHLRAIHGRNGQQIITGIRAQVAEAGGSDQFIDRRLVPAARILDDVMQARHAGTPESAEISQLLTYFNWLQSSEWVAPVMAFWQRSPSDSAGLVSFLRSLDRLLMLLRILGHGVDKRGQRLNAILKAIQSRAPLERDSALFALSRDEQRGVLFNMRDLYARSPQTCKLVLMRISDSLSGRAEGYRPDIFTVEHVLPLKPNGQSKWQEWYRDADVRRKLAASIGNLVLVSKQVNDRAGNLDFDQKLRIYFGTPATPQAHVTQRLQGKASWKPEDVRDNEIVMMEHVIRLWSLNEKAEDAEIPKRPTWARFGRALAGRA